MDDYEQSYRRIPAPLLGAVYLIALNWWSYGMSIPEFLIRLQYFTYRDALFYWP